MASSYFFNAKARLACSTEPSSVTADGTASVVDLHTICELIDCPEFTQNIYFFSTHEVIQVGSQVCYKGMLSEVQVGDWW